MMQMLTVALMILNDGVKDNVDICPFDSADGCPAALQDVPTNVTEEVPGCIHPKC